MTTALTINGLVEGCVISYPCEKQRFKSWFEQSLEFFTVSHVETPKISTKLIINKVKLDIVNFQLSSRVFN